MNWEAIGAVGEVLGAAAVVVSLIYLAIQIRQNTRALRGTFHDSDVNRIQAWLLAMANDSNLSSLLFRTRRGGELDEEERHRIGLLLNYGLLGSEAVYFQKLRGNVDAEVWQAQLARLRGMLELPWFCGWWRDEQRFPLTATFERFVEQELQRESSD